CSRRVLVNKRYFSGFSSALPSGRNTRINHCVTCNNSVRAWRLCSNLLRRRRKERSAFNPPAGLAARQMPGRGHRLLATGKQRKAGRAAAAHPGEQRTGQSPERIENSRDFRDKTYRGFGQVVAAHGQGPRERGGVLRDGFEAARPAE